MTGDADDEKSMEQAFRGAYGAFCVTNFWEHMSPEREIAQATAMARAAKTAGIQHAIWSTLEDSRKYIPLHDDRMPTLHGKWKVPHFDAKSVGDESFREAGVPTTFLLTSFYWDNLIHFGMGPRPGEDGTLGFVLPMGERKLPGIAASDIGAAAYAIFKAGKEYIGKTVGISGEHLSGAEMAAQMSALGREVKHLAVPPQCIARSISPARTTWATCSSSTTISPSSSGKHAMWSFRVASTRLCRPFHNGWHRTRIGYPSVSDNSSVTRGNMHRVLQGRS